jgi:hypothetical protein
VADRRLNTPLVWLLALLVAPSVLAACGSTRGPGAVTVRIDPSHVLRSVPRSFLGVSTEWDSVEPYAGPTGRRNAALQALLAPLVARTGGLALRIGGDTADQAWWNPRGRPRPPTVRQDVTPATLDAVGWLAGTLGGPVTLDVNLALGDPSNARALGAAARRRLPARSLDTLEIGNEPDLYTRARRWRVPGHLHVRTRKRTSYGPADYRRGALRYLDVLSAPPRAAPRLAIAGFAGRAWWPTLPGLIASAGGRVGALSGHLYALPRCGGRAPPATWLLTATASRARAASMAALIGIAHSHRLPARITELNSAACGGRPHFSDAFASALWLTDTLFALLREGVDQADVHTWAHARYALFDVAGGRATARPPLTAMEAFARAAPPRSRLVAARVGRGSLRVWATVDPAGTVRVALIAPAAVRARVVAAGSHCAIAWVASRRSRRTTRICPRQGRITVALPARALAVLTIPPVRLGPAARAPRPYRQIASIASACRACASGATPKPSANVRSRP